MRIACRELESWVAGDLEALSQGYDCPSIVAHAQKRSFRDPDALVSPIDHLRRIVPAYQKVDGSRRVGPLLSPERSKSKSFKAFCDGVKRLVNVGLTAEENGL